MKLAKVFQAELEKIEYQSLEKLEEAVISYKKVIELKYSMKSYYNLATPKSYPPS